MSPRETWKTSLKYGWRYDQQNIWRKYLAGWGSLSTELQGVAVRHFVLKLKLFVVIGLPSSTITVAMLGWFIINVFM